MTTYKLRQQARILYGNSHNARKWVRSMLYLAKNNLFPPKVKKAERIFDYE